MEREQEINEWLKKVEKMKKENKLDLSSDEDLSIAIMNLISIEEHFFFTGAKTRKSEYYDLLNQIRKIRRELLKKIVKSDEPGSEIWCISKHLLAASMRLIEVGTKYYSQAQDKRKEAEDLFDKAYNLYSLFWGINLKLVNLEEIKKIDEEQLNIHHKEKGGLWNRLGEIVKKIIDCCKE